ncbi:unnamed protein product [Victoria cruziana]
MQPEAQVQIKAKSQYSASRKLEGGLQKHLISPFAKGKCQC